MAPPLVLLQAVGREEEKDAVICSQADFSWGEEQERATLRGVTLTVRRGGLVAVVGGVGAGKSSLLSAVLGDLRMEGGSLNVSASVAYVPQQVGRPPKSL